MLSCYPAVTPALAPAASATTALAPAADKMAANMILPGEPLLFYTVSPPPVLGSIPSAPATMFPFMTPAPNVNGVTLAAQFIPVSCSQ